MGLLTRLVLVMDVFGVKIAKRRDNAKIEQRARRAAAGAARPSRVRGYHTSFAYYPPR